MKKAIILFISITLFFSFISCGGGGIEGELKKIIGGGEGWNLEVFNNIKLNMSYDEVKALYPQLEDDRDYPWAYLEDHPVVDYYAFYFDEGKLVNVEVNLLATLDVEEVREACLTLLKAKWGEPDETDEDYYYWYGEDYYMNMFYLYVDAWVIEVDLK
jgi:hypothetical protein